MCQDSKKSSQSVCWSVSKTQHVVHSGLWFIIELPGTQPSSPPVLPRPALRHSTTKALMGTASSWLGAAILLENHRIKVKGVACVLLFMISLAAFFLPHFRVLPSFLTRCLESCLFSHHIPWSFQSINPHYSTLLESALTSNRPHLGLKVKF